MRVLVSASSPELDLYLRAAHDAVRELGWQEIETDPVAVPSVESCFERVDRADLVLVIVGWSLAAGPGPDLGGDGRRAVIQWESQRAFQRAKPVVVLMADETWPTDEREDDTAARAWLRDFRGELSRLAVFFDHESPSQDSLLPRFRARVHKLLARFRDGRGAAGKAPRHARRTLELRRWPNEELPPRPYPLLLPYAHPETMGGREHELEELHLWLSQPIPILGLYAPSGSGKSSILLAGLVPGLRGRGRVVAYDRYPQEAGLARRILGDLLLGEGLEEIGDDPEVFIELLLEAARLGGEPPVLVIDQFEEVMRPSRHRERARIGTLLAASMCRTAGWDGPPCRWILAYRQEFHGAVFIWLGDVLREARREHLPGIDLLPHDLAGAERFRGWPLPPFGAPPPGTVDAAEAAARAFRSAIEKPLALKRPDGAPRYPWHFAPGAADRLATAFAEARCAAPSNPLVPELQVVLSHLLEFSGRPGKEESVEISVPEDSGTLIDRALEGHLRRALENAFPMLSDTDARRGRTRALLALREMADVSGRRTEGLPAGLLADAIGPAGHEILEKLATPGTRLVLLDKHLDEWAYVLSHDRMAEAIVHAVDEHDGHGDLAVDSRLLALRRFVTLNTELFAAGEIDPSTRVKRGHFRRIEANSGALLWDENRQQWWQACRERWQRERRRRATAGTVAAALVTLVAAVTWFWVESRAGLEALYEQAAAGEPAAAFMAVYQLANDPRADDDELRARLRRRDHPFEFLERGLAGLDPPRRGAAVLRAAEIVLPMIAAAPNDPARRASLLWALDTFPAREAIHRRRAAELRDAALADLRQGHPPPPLPAADDPDWIRIPPPDPAVPWTGPAFRMLRHEVTNAEYRRLVPDHPGGGELPVVFVSWYAAYVYAAWLGGQLPTGAEWEYATQAACEKTFCNRHGEAVTINEVAWNRANAVDPATHESTLRPGMRLEPNPLGFYDLLGNAWEWTKDWSREIPGLTAGDAGAPLTGRARVIRGGSFWAAPLDISVNSRENRVPGTVSRNIGLRVVIPP